MLGYTYSEQDNRTTLILDYTGELPVTIVIPEQESIALPEDLPHEISLPHPPDVGIIQTRFSVILHKGYFAFTLKIEDKIWNIRIPEFPQP